MFDGIFDGMLDGMLDSRHHGRLDGMLGGMLERGCTADAVAPITAISADASPVGTGPAGSSTRWAGIPTASQLRKTLASSHVSSVSCVSITYT